MFSSRSFGSSSIGGIPREDIASRSAAADDSQNKDLDRPMRHPAGPPVGTQLCVNTIGDYSVGKFLGNGVFSTVHQGSMANGRKVAIKIIDKKMISKRNLKDNVRREVSIMKKLCHRNVLGLIDVLASKARLYLVTELMEGGNLQTYVNNKGKLCEDEAKFMFLQLIQGLDFCHRHYVWHRDLKPENLLLDATHKVLKISDFGLSILLEHENATLQTTCGTPFYVAPEVLRRKGYRGATVDVWSAGCVLFCLMTGTPPFRGETPAILCRQILHGEPYFPETSEVSPQAERFVRRILETRELDRIKIPGILADPWMSDAKEESINLNGLDEQASRILEVNHNELSDAIMEIVDEKSTVEQVPTSVLDLVALSGAFDLPSLFAPTEESVKPNFGNKYGPQIILCKIDHEKLVRMIMQVTTDLGFGGQLIKWKWLHIVGDNNATCICIAHSLSRGFRIISFGGESAAGFGIPVDEESRTLCHIMHDAVHKQLKSRGALLK